MWSLGVPRGEAEFHDVYGLDADALAMVPQPVLAVVFCFPDPPEDSTSPPEQVLATEDKESLDEVYFIKQIDSLGNGCGTIALLHAVGNACSEISLLENSGLDLFFKSTASTSMDPYECARVLEKDDCMARAHSLAASAGDTEIGDIVEEHYVCFTALNGTLYELDGMKGGPIKHGPSSPESLLQPQPAVEPQKKHIYQKKANSSSSVAHHAAWRRSSHQNSLQEDLKRDHNRQQSALA